MYIYYTAVFIVVIITVIPGKLRGTSEQNWYQQAIQRPGATNDVTVGRKSFCLHTFDIIREMHLFYSKCVYF